MGRRATLTKLLLQNIGQTNNLNNRLNVIDFGGLFSCNAIGSGRSRTHDPSLSFGFVSARTHDDGRFLNLIDEHTRARLLVRTERRWSSSMVISALADVMVMKGVPEHLRSDHGPEFVLKDLRKWLAKT
jgi:hypothetical protein